MIPLEQLTAEEQAAYREGLALVIPKNLKDSLVGKPIEGTSYFATKEGDPTKSGYVLVNDCKVYLTMHQPTGSKVQYRKINHAVHGDCWEAVSQERED